MMNESGDSLTHFTPAPRGAADGCPPCKLLSAGWIPAMLKCFALPFYARPAWGCQCFHNSCCDKGCYHFTPAPRGAACL